MRGAVQNGNGCTSLKISRIERPDPIIFADFYQFSRIDRYLSK